ncbi:MAG: GC-type dockerin domain-anchored protein [Phycisphaerales bacterium]
MRTAAALLGCLAITAHADVIHVNANAPSGGNGVKWDSAYNDLQTALANASSGDQLWVARGTYSPKLPGDETSTFTIPTGVFVFGGFQGNERDLEDRPGDPLGDPSILDGQGGILHVVSADNATATLNGFVITGGNANGLGTQPRSGGALLATDSFLTLANLYVVDCAATLHGAGVAAFGTGSLAVSSCAFSNCVAFSATTSGVQGGAIHAEHELSIIDSTFESCGAQRGGAVSFESNDLCVISSCRFESNTAEFGGGAIWFDSTPSNFTLVERSDFLANTAESSAVGRGGAIAYSAVSGGIHHVFSCRFLGNNGGRYSGAIDAEFASSAATANIQNSFFTGNSAQTGGVISNRGSGNVNIANATMTNNTADFAGAVHNAASRLDIYNAIITGNTSVGGTPIADNVFAGGAGPIVVSYSLIGLWDASLPGTHSSGADPMFVDADGPDNTPGTDDDDPSVMPASPAIDAAFDAALDINIVTDIEGNPRFLDDTGTPDTGVSSSITPPLDIGAAEFQGTTPASCLADLDNNGVLNLDDISAFANAFISGDLLADLDDNAVLNLDDIATFASAFLAGC